MASSLNATQSKGYTFIETFFESTRDIFTIPNYQRNFEWLPEKTSRFFDAIMDSECSRFYMGHFLLKKRTDHPRRHKRYNICDGQQRIIFAFLVLLIIEQNRYLKDEDCEKIRKKIYCNDESLKLEINNADQALFRKLVSIGQNADTYDFSKKETSKRLYKSYDLLKQKLGCLSVSDREKFWKKFCDCKCTYLVCDEDDDEHVIFANINTENQPLTEYTMIRQYLMDVPEMDANQVNNDIKAIDDLMAALCGKNEKYIYTYQKEFINFFIKLTTHAKEPEASDKIDHYPGYHTYVRWFDSTGMTRLEAVSEMKKYAHIYYNIKNAIENKVNVKNFDIYGTSKVLNIKVTIALLMSLLYEQEKGLVTDKDIKKIGVYMKTYLVRGAIVGNSSRGGVFETEMYSGVYKAIKCVNMSSSKNITVSDEFIARCTKMFQNRCPMPTDQEVYDSLISNNTIGLSNKKKDLVKLILNEIENQSADEPVDTSNCDIDHVLPENPSESELSYSSWTEETRKEYVYMLGNLALLDKQKNRSGEKSNKLSNVNVFYQDSRLKTNQYIKDNADNWTKENIIERTEMLTDKILEVFRYV